MLAVCWRQRCASVDSEECAMDVVQTNLPSLPPGAMDLYKKGETQYP